MASFIVLICNKEKVQEIFPEAATGCVLQKKLFLKFFQILKEITYVGVSF